MLPWGQRLSNVAWAASVSSSPSRWLVVAQGGHCTKQGATEMGKNGEQSREQAFEEGQRCQGPTSQGNPIIPVQCCRVVENAESVRRRPMYRSKLGMQPGRDLSEGGVGWGGWDGGLRGDYPPPPPTVYGRFNTSLQPGFDKHIRHLPGKTYCNTVPSHKTKNRTAEVRPSRTMLSSRHPGLEWPPTPIPACSSAQQLATTSNNNKEAFISIQPAAGLGRGFGMSPWICCSRLQPAAPIGRSPSAALPFPFLEWGS